MSFRETQSLLSNHNNTDQEDYSYPNKERCRCKTIFLILTLVVLVPFLLWITSILQPSEVHSTVTLAYSHPGNPNHADSDPNNIATVPTSGNTTIYTFTFIVSETIVCPDNFLQKGFVINGQSPGPEIRVKKDSILMVHVINKLRSEVTFHFHGIHQRKSFLSDGVPMVTQNPIPPGGTFTYKINIWPQVGTFFYHAHTAMDIVWLNGPVIIEDDPTTYKSLPKMYHYDEERVFTLNGIYHESLPQVMDRITGPVKRDPAVTHSISFNGKSYGFWEGDNANNYKNCAAKTGYHVTTVEKSKTYRFRFINAASDSLLSCNVTSHTLVIIETDGIYVDPVVTDHIVLTPGQRYSVIIKMDQEVDNYHISCKHMELSGPLNGIAILHYNGAPTQSEVILREDRVGFEAMPMDRWVIDKLSPNINILKQIDFYQVPKNVDREFVIDVSEIVLNNQQHMYLINGLRFEEPTVPYFMQLRRKQNITNSPLVFEILEGESIQIVFQNQRTDNFCASHPWHIHGHSFHVVGEGANRYDPITDGHQIQKNITIGKQFQFRDSVTVYANQTVGEYTNGAHCGWTAVRFTANNPGIWLVHCHITPHMLMGKKFVIWEHSKDDPYLQELMRTQDKAW